MAAVNPTNWVSSWSFVAIVASLAVTVSSAEAVPVTTGQGPGGFEAANGSSNLQLWLKSDAGLYQDTAGTSPVTASGQAVARWADVSGHPTRVLTQNAVGNRPVYTQNIFNGLPAIGFKQDGTTDVLNGSFNAVPGTVARTVFLIARPDGDNPNTTNYGMIDLGAQAGPASGNGYGITPEVAVRVSGNQVYVGALSTSAGSVLTIRAPANSTVGPTGTTQAFINGVSLATNPASAAATINTSGVTELGRLQFVDGNDFKGRLGEVVVYNRELNNAERTIVENYLSARFNVGGTTVGVNQTLGTNDFYAGDLDTNGDYDFDVVGVGNSGTGTSLIAGAAGFGIEVAAGSGTGLAGSGEYLMAGHDATANTLIAVESNNPLFTGARWARSWYVDKTGTLDATIAFDFEDAGLTLPAPGTTYSLLYSADSNFSDGWVKLAETNAISSGTVAFNLANALLLDGYYTLGLNVQLPEPTSLAQLLGVLGCAAFRRRRLKRG